MKRSIFGDARPKGVAEIRGALEEQGVSGDDCYVLIEEGEDGFGTHGWTAEALTNEEGNDVFETLAYSTREELIADLKAVGITQID